MTKLLPSVAIVRKIKAPPAKVWAAITQPKQMIQWWGPDAGPTLSAEADVRPGGRFSVVFRLLTLIHERLPDDDARNSHEQGWSGLLDKLPIFLGVVE